MFKRKKHQINLVDRNEGIDYSDEFGSFSFSVCLANGVWEVELPGYKWEKGKPFPMNELHRYIGSYTDEEDEKRISPRVKSYLSIIWWFGIFPCWYRVRFTKKS